MTKQEFIERIKEYQKTKPEYGGTLSHIFMFCQEDFLPVFEQAEKENKELYLKDKDNMDDTIDAEPYVELKDIGIR